MDGSDALSFLNIGVIFACFQISGTLPDDTEKLNSSHSGEERGRLSSLRIRLLIWSGPVAFPVFKYFNAFSTSIGVKLRVSNTSFFFFFRFSDCVCYLISIMFIVFKVCFGFSAFIFVVQTLSFSHHFLIELVSQFGSDCLTFITLLEMIFSETFIIC